MERKVILIAGPTCSCKTELGIHLAEKLNGEIISADSRQIYKHLKIGTAKPSKEELKKIKHHFIDELEPDTEFNASKFEVESLKIINEIFNQGKIPIVVGGSGLYIRALVEGIMNTVDTDSDYRNELYSLQEKYGNQYLYDELKRIDPTSAESMLPQNWKRVIRCLEVFHLSGKPIWKWQGEFERKIDFEYVQYGLNWQREILYKNIDNRVDRMIVAGLIEEVTSILSMGYSKNMYALNTVGYKEIVSLLEGEIDLNRAIELIKRNTRRYAKKQLTWFRAMKEIDWLEINSRDEIPEIANRIAGCF